MADIERICDDLDYAVDCAEAEGMFSLDEAVELREFIDRVRTGEVYDR